MSGLFFDILLHLGGVPDPSTIYPPSSIPALKHLLDAIESASYDDMKRDCLVYYLLKQTSDGRDERYIDEKVISPQYVALADAYWQLDNGINLDGAISKLSDARIVRNYTTKIIETLALDSDSANLIRKFVRTCKPPLAETSAIERYIVATAEHSVVEAWKYQRTFPDHYSDRKKLLHVLLTWVLTPKPKPQPLTQLLALPFSRYEDAALQDFAMHPPENVPPASVGVVRDMVCVRLIQSCKYAAAVRFVRQYPSSGVGARGTWSAKRERIVKDILSIMPAVERDLLENELAALGEDTRIRTSTMGSSSANQSWIGGSLGASGSTDLGTSWEDIGRRTAANAPRKSLGARPRTSLPNGIPAKPAGMFTTSAGPSTAGQQPLSAQSTLVSQNGTGSISMNSPAHRFPTFISTAESPASAARLFAQKAPHSQQPKTNGVANGIAKKNGFTTRNAFFEPAAPRNPSPEPFHHERHPVDPMASASPKRAPTKPTTRLPTPPRDDDAERTQESSPTDDGEQEQDQVYDADRRKERETPSVISIDESVDKQQVEEEISDRERDEGLGYSIFNGAIPPMRTPSSGATSPKNVRKSPSWRNDDAYSTVAEGSQRKKLKVAVPGAFVMDGDGEEDHEHEHELPSPTSANADRLRFGATAPAAASRTASGAGVRRSTRKRAVSPEENDAHHHVNISIPGTLFEEEEEQDQGRHHHHQQTNGRTHRRTETTDEEGEEAEEEADELAPLPKQPSERRNRRKTDPSLRALSNSNNNLRTPQRRTTRSLRSNSTEPDENLVSKSTGRPVRRSSRLQSAEVSPTAAINASKMSVHVKGKDKDREREREGGRERRPKKSSRTASEAGATTVGRGSSGSKRR
ncbi:uncharacterized protein FOMMEDRAFT_113319 [Fomitiporia mediterranea MF3/22]|uniref:uncharacterized protein n=1 Tax=Fomitiporia mediterranea (strain MF3/22) TaxID=694068 RepID=UPI0004409A1B|nr:uncharacterized protein FOMMEDRAFT_113319 [Fomitiporia mediterranea MF3/22]EJC99352.1 hypothetical protein FOMMEDRAFT_113319 [Fomitiporia mediterranea MF3/22]